VVEALRIAVDAAHTVSGLAIRPAGAAGCLVLAHGAGAGMTHPFMAAVAQGLAERSVATVRYQFPYMEAGSKRPDRAALAHATVRASVAAASERFADLRLFAGGKSFGARMTSEAQAEAPLPGVRGLIFLGFPLHAAKQPGETRAQHLSEVRIPMLFVQGMRDALADPALLVPLAQRLPGATLHAIEHADHSFHVPVRSGLTDPAVMADLLDTVADWIAGRH
jgi:predicted alpha/beta-hydrolase family hydrolase